MTWIPLSLARPAAHWRVLMRYHSDHETATIIGAMQPDEPDKFWHDGGFYLDVERVSHWMPIPEPPKEGE